MKALVVTAPAELRESLDGLTTSALAKRCKNFRPSRLVDPKTAAKYALRSLAYRYRQLSDELRDLDAELKRLTWSVAPALVNAFGVGPDTAATLLIAGEVIRPAPHRGSLCLAVWRKPDTGIIGQDEPTPTQRWRPPGQRGTLSHSHRQAGSRPEDTGIHAASNRRGNEQARRHPLSQTLCRPRSLLRHSEAWSTTAYSIHTEVGL